MVRLYTLSLLLCLVACTNWTIVSEDEGTPGQKVGEPNGPSDPEPIPPEDKQDAIWGWARAALAGVLGGAVIGTILGVKHHFDVQALKKTPEGQAKKLKKQEAKNLTAFQTAEPTIVTNAETMYPNEHMRAAILQSMANLHQDQSIWNQLVISDTLVDKVPNDEKEATKKRWKGYLALFVDRVWGPQLKDAFTPTQEIQVQQEMEFNQGSFVFQLKRASTFNFDISNMKVQRIRTGLIRPFEAKWNQEMLQLLMQMLDGFNKPIQTDEDLTQPFKKTGSWRIMRDPNIFFMKPGRAQEISRAYFGFSTPALIQEQIRFQVLSKGNQEMNLFELAAENGLTQERGWAMRVVLLLWCLEQMGASREWFVP